MRILNKMAFVVAAVSALGFASASQAQVFSTSPSSVVGGSPVFTSAPGGTYLSQTIALTCNVSVGGTISGAPGSGSLSSVSRSISGAFPCGLGVFPIGTWSVTAVSAATQTISVYIEANTIANDPCRGTVTLPIQADRRTISLIDVKLPADSGRADRVCTIDGDLVSNIDVYVL